MDTELAIDYFDGAQELADALGISKQAVYQWGDTVPPRRALEIEKLTRGKLKAPPLAKGEAA